MMNFFDVDPVKLPELRCHLSHLFIQCKEEIYADAEIRSKKKCLIFFTTDFFCFLSLLIPPGSSANNRNVSTKTFHHISICCIGLRKFNGHISFLQVLYCQFL